MPRVLFNFFGLLWFYSVLAMVPAPWLVAHEAKGLVASGAVTAQERRRFIAGFTIVAYTLTGIQVWFALATGNRNPLCQDAGSAGTVANVVVATLLLIGLGWLWLGDGAAFLARFAPVFLLSRTKTYTARQVWWVVGAIALLLATIDIPAGKWHRSVQTTLCTEQRRMPDPVEQLRWWLRQSRREA